MKKKKLVKKGLKYICRLLEKIEKIEKYVRRAK